MGDLIPCAFAPFGRPSCASKETAQASLACLRASSLNDRYHAWRGFSGARYTVSIFPVDRAADGDGLPAFEAFILVPVIRDGRSLEPTGVVAIETEADRFAAVAAGVADGASEWHVHLLAEGARQRRAVVEDLLQRHRSAGRAMLSA